MGSTARREDVSAGRRVKEGEREGKLPLPPGLAGCGGCLCAAVPTELAPARQEECRLNSEGLLHTPSFTEWQRPRHMPTGRRPELANKLRVCNLMALPAARQDLGKPPAHTSYPPPTMFPSSCSQLASRSARHGGGRRERQKRQGRVGVGSAGRGKCTHAPGSGGQLRRTLS